MGGSCEKIEPVEEPIWFLNYDAGGLGSVRPDQTSGWIQKNARNRVSQTYRKKKGS